MKEKKIIYNFCLLKIKPTSNNVFITLTDFDGNVILKSSAGVMKLTGKKKGTAYAGEAVVKNLILNLKKYNIQINLLLIELYGFIKNSMFNKIFQIFEKLKVTIVINVINYHIKAHNGVLKKKLRRL